MRKVLVVEDDDEMLELLREEAADADVELDAARNGEELDAKLESGDYDAYVLDLQIPDTPDGVADVQVGLRGLELLASRGLGPKTVVYSAWDEIENVVRALNSGALFWRKEDWSDVNLFKNIESELFRAGGTDSEAAAPSRDQRDLRLNLEILDSTSPGPEIALTLARSILGADRVTLHKIDRRESSGSERLHLVPLRSRGPKEFAESEEISKALQRSGIVRLSEFYANPSILEMDPSPLGMIPLHRRDGPEVFCLAVYVSKGGLDDETLRHFYSAYRLSLWYMLVSAQGSSERGGAWVRLVRRLENLALSVMSDWVRPAIGAIGLCIALVGVVLATGSLWEFFPQVFLPFVGHHDRHHFAVEVLSFIEEMWLSVLLLIFSFGLFAMAGRRYRDDVPAWLEQYNDLGYIKRLLVGLMVTMLGLAFLRFVLEGWSSEGVALSLQSLAVAILCLLGIVGLSVFLVAMSRAD